MLFFIPEWWWAAFLWSSLTTPSCKWRLRRRSPPISVKNLSNFPVSCSTGFSQKRWPFCRLCSTSKCNLWMKLLRRRTKGHVAIKGTQEWEFCWLRFWILYYFMVSYAEIIRFWGKKFLIGPLGGELRLFRVVLRLRGMKKFIKIGQIFFYFLNHIWPFNIC